MSEEQAVLHHAEELGQARPYTSEEAQALLRLALIVGLWAGALGLAVGMGVWLHDRYGFWSTFYILALPVGVIVGGGLVLAKGCHEQLDGLRSWREATTYAPPQPTAPQLPSPWRPPVPAHHQGGTTMVDMNERPMLPSPEQARQITPPVVAEILRASIEEYGGQWSRRKLMRLRVLGQRVTRGMYEELTGALHQCGVLRQNRQGGFELPHDIKQYEDLEPYLPNLPGLGGMGGGTGRDGNGGDSDDPPPGGGVGTLAERRKQKFMELGCDVVAYLEWRGNHGL